MTLVNFLIGLPVMRQRPALPQRVLPPLVRAEGRTHVGVRRLSAPPSTERAAPGPPARRYPF